MLAKASVINMCVWRFYHIPFLLRNTNQKKREERVCRVRWDGDKGLTLLVTLRAHSKKSALLGSRPVSAWNTKGFSDL